MCCFSFIQNRWRCRIRAFRTYIYVHIHIIIVVIIVLLPLLSLSIIITPTTTIIIPQSVILVVCDRPDDVVHKFVRKITVLRFVYLPSTYNRCSQDSIIRGAARWPMCELINYVCQQWIEHSELVPRHWTGYHITVRFSHDRSGWFWHGSVYFTT